MIKIKIIQSKIDVKEIEDIASEQFGDMVKLVVDINREIMAIGGDLHADEEALLIENGSIQQDLWGVNFYIDKRPEERIEFDSMINIRPSQNNRSRDVEDNEVRKKIVKIIDKLVIND